MLLRVVLTQLLIVRKSWNDYCLISFLKKLYLQYLWSIAVIRQVQVLLPKCVVRAVKVAQPKNKAVSCLELGHS